MARWRLDQPHYLNIPGIEWEHKETDRTTGRAVRKMYAVPQLLEPNNPADHNYPGEIIVCDKESKLFPRDYVFSGEPTPDMTPLDEDAEAISERLKPKWVHPIESLPAGQDYSTALMAMFEKQIAALGGIKATPAPVGQQIDPSAFATLQDQVRQLMEQNAKLMAKLAGEEPVEYEPLDDEPIEVPPPVIAKPAGVARRV